MMLTYRRTGQQVYASGRGTHFIGAGRNLRKLEFELLRSNNVSDRSDEPREEIDTLLTFP